MRKLIIVAFEFAIGLVIGCSDFQRPSYREEAKNPVHLFLNGKRDEALEIAKNMQNAALFPDPQIIYKKAGHEEFSKGLIEKFEMGGVTNNYIPRRNLNTITIKKGNKKLTYKISDVLNGAYKLESGANLEDIAFYVPKRSIVKVQLKTGNDFKPANGYWIKDGAKPIHVTKFDEGGVMSRLLTRKKDQPKVETIDEDIDLKEDSRIRVRPSSFVSKDKEGDWMMKKNSSKEARAYAGGGKVTFSEKAKAIAKNFEGKRVEPKYQKEYGKVYDTKEAKEVGNKIAGSQKASYDSKAEKGAVVSKGKGNHKMKATTDLARKIRKDGEKWTDAIKRASQQLK